MVPALLSSAASIFPYEQIVPASIEKFIKSPPVCFFVIISNRYGHLSARADFPGKTRCRGRFFLQVQKTPQDPSSAEHVAPATNYRPASRKKKHTSQDGVCFLAAACRLVCGTKKIPAISASIRASTKKKPRTRIACRVSRLGLWLQKDVR